MIKHRPRPSKASGSQLQFEKLLEAMGFGQSADPLDHFTRFGLTQKLEEIKRYFARYVSVSAQPDRKLVKRYRATLEKLLTLSEEIGPDFLANEIEKAGWARHNPDADEMTLNMLVEEHSDRRNMVTRLTSHGEDIDHWLNTSGDDYRKRAVRKLVVEPFLRLLMEHGITTSRKKLPRTRMFEAMFEWVGVESRFRLSNAAINKIARELTSASSSESNALQRTEN